MRVRLNGSEAEVERGATVADLVARTGGNAQGRGVAVALNGEVVAHAEWRATALSEGDHVEVLGAIGGG